MTGGTVEVECVGFSLWHDRVFNSFKAGSSEFDVVLIDRCSA